MTAMILISSKWFDDVGKSLFNRASQQSPLQLHTHTWTRQREIRDGRKGEKKPHHFLVPSSKILSVCLSPLHHKARASPPLPSFFISPGYRSPVFPSENLRANDRPVPNKKRTRRRRNIKRDRAHRVAFVSNRRPIDLFRFVGIKRSRGKISFSYEQQKRWPDSSHSGGGRMKDPRVFIS